MKPSSLFLLLLSLGIAAAALAEALTQLPPASDKQGITYATDIKPIFDSHCVKCHSGDKPKARLKMDTLEGILKGTKQGPIVVAGDSSKSFILKSIAHLSQDHDTWMPPMPNKAGIKPLTQDEISLIRAWIEQGAK